MVQSYFVEAFEYAAARGKKALIVCDVDEALLKTMSRETTTLQRQLIGDWYDLSAGNLFFMSGRAHDSLDEAWGRNLPGSYEHHSMMRIEENGSVMRLAPDVNTEIIGEHAREKINGSIRVVDTPEEVWAAKGKEPVVYVEKKRLAVALVHSLGHDKNTHDDLQRALIKQVAKPVRKLMGLKKTHRVFAGSDAVEIVPKVHSLCSEAERVLPMSEHIRIAEVGLGKATGIHNLMALKGDDYIPFMLGDSPNSDGPAMIACIQHGGYGIGVANGNNLPDNFRLATGDRIIPTYKATWGHIDGMVSHLKAQPTSVVDMEPRQMVAGMHNT